MLQRAKLESVGIELKACRVFVDLDQESCEIDPSVADELCIAELELKETRVESKEEGDRGVVRAS